MRSMVEGYAVSSAAYDLPYPSTTLRVVPLPLRGRTSNDRFSPHNGHQKTLSYMARLCQPSSRLFQNVDQSARSPASKQGRQSRDLRAASSQSAAAQG